MRTFHSGGVAGSDITQGLPRVEELFEARQPKKPAVISEIRGTAHISMAEGSNIHTVTVRPDAEQPEGVVAEVKEYQIPYGTKLSIIEGQHLEVGEAMTEGNKAPADIMRVLGLDAVYEYLIKEIQKVYRSQACNVNDKHVEIIARQMTRKMRVEDSGSTDLLVGSSIDVLDLEKANNEIDARIAAGEEGLTHATGSTILLGITKASLQTESFMSAASFQETTKVLTEAAIHGKVDYLRGLKENVIIGKLIPAGTGMDCYKGVGVRKVQ
jgi:DNA-directed RNA polymerase subunit beta'